MNNKVKAAWNSRFGLYGPGNLDPGSAVPDFTGYSYGPDNWKDALGQPKRYDAFPDFQIRESEFVSFGSPNDTRKAGEDLTGLDIQNSFKPLSPSGSGGPYSRGAKRRLVTMPVIDCRNWDSTHQAELKGWACALMVTPAHKKDKNLTGEDYDNDYVLEYLGEAGAENVPCGTYGQGGGTGPRVPTLVR
jgi:hypothetical protein